MAPKRQTIHRGGTPSNSNNDNSQTLNQVYYTLHERLRETFDKGVKNIANNVVYPYLLDHRNTHDFDRVYDNMINVVQKSIRAAMTHPEDVLSCIEDKRDDNTDDTSDDDDENTENNTDTDSEEKENNVYNNNNNNNSVIFNDSEEANSDIDKVGMYEEIMGADVRNSDAPKRNASRLYLLKQQATKVVHDSHLSTQTKAERLRDILQRVVSLQQYERPKQ